MNLEKDDELLSDAERLTKAKADKIELDIAIKKGELVPAHVIKREWEQMIFNFKTRLEQLPQSVAPDLATESNPVAIEKLLKKRINEALDELSRGKKVSG